MKPSKSDFSRPLTIALMTVLAATALAPVATAGPSNPSPYPVTEQAIEHPPTDLLLQLGALESLPYPALMPYPMPPGYVLTDVRVHYLPHAREGYPRSYTLVYAGGDRSFMLQSRLPGYNPSMARCPGSVLASSGPLWLAGYSYEPQTLELVSPACSITGQALSPGAISPEQAGLTWQRLHWFLPLPFRARRPWSSQPQDPRPPYLLPVF